MNRIFKCSVLLTLLLTFAMPSTFATALDRTPSKPLWKNQAHFKKTVSAYKLLTEKDLTKAASKFEKLSRRFTDPYEKSQAKLGLAQTYLAQQFSTKAIPVMEELIEMDTLDNEQHFKTMLELADIYYRHQQFNKAYYWLARWQAESGNAVSEEQVQYMHDQLSQLSFKVDQTELLPAPVFKVRPVYPRGAAISKLEGYAIVRFTVDENGNVIGPEVTESRPKRIFDRAAREAILQWKYKPRVQDDGQPVASRATQRFDFRLAEF